MAEDDSTQRDTPTGIAAELATAGFEDVQEIGRGGFGVAYRCAQRALDRTVAIKVLTADGRTTCNDSSASSARWESSPGTRISSASFRSVLTASGRPYIVMQYHPAGSRDARIHKVGPLDWGDAVHIGVEVAGALVHSPLDRLTRAYPRCSEGPLAHRSGPESAGPAAFSDVPRVAPDSPALGQCGAFTARTGQSASNRTR